MTNAAKETKAQRVERLKRAFNPWEGLEEIRRFAREGFESIPPEWIGTYFRWWGVYTQGDGAGVTGGQGGEGRALQRFMVRIRIPNGMMSSQQLRAIAQLTRRHANGIADLTVRQNIQLHWVTIESLPEVLEGLWQVGLNTTGACGDVVRNVTGCPVAGVDAHEIVDASPLVLEASRLLAGNSEFYNLPRKFKVSIAGCKAWCSYPEINDIGLTALTRVVGGKPEVGFSLRVAGGLSTEPYLGARLNAFVRWNQVLPVIKGIAELFRDSEVLREHRERARLKFLFLRHGWTAERFLGELQERIGFTLDPAVEEHPPDDVYRDHVGIRGQKQPGLSYVGAVALRGRITADQMLVAADLADRFAGGELRVTSMQNLLVVNVPTINAGALAKELDAIGLKVGGSPFWRGTVACSGTEFCKLAITETKSFSRWLVEELEERLPGFDQHLKLHVTGCPNSCGQHWIADIGIEGKKIKVQDRLVDAYYFCVGGALGLHQATARPVGYRCAATEVADALERLLGRYLAERGPGENLRRFFVRHSDAELREFLAGEMVTAVARDLPDPASRLSHSAGGIGD
ncbi:MAG TPA: nitrite/sulfite reductase [Candidatus Sulfotelmatobacter sp.]|jgi:sulfite reductase (ferredoxin)|nr:nitrite/sulfite reductase [Candidatus Sulfotelmatobacter sp.]